jgi:hypothetical protein
MRYSLLALERGERTYVRVRISSLYQIVNLHESDSYTTRQPSPTRFGPCKILLGCFPASLKPVKGNIRLRALFQIGISVGRHPAMMRTNSSTLFYNQTCDCSL